MQLLPRLADVHDRLGSRENKASAYERLQPAEGEMYCMFDEPQYLGVLIPILRVLEHPHEFRGESDLIPDPL